MNARPVASSAELFQYNAIQATPVNGATSGAAQSLPQMVHFGSNVGTATPYNASNGELPAFMQKALNALSQDPLVKRIKESFDEFRQQQKLANEMREMRDIQQELNHQQMMQQQAAFYQQRQQDLATRLTQLQSNQQQALAQQQMAMQGVQQPATAGMAQAPQSQLQAVKAALGNMAQWVGHDGRPVQQGAMQQVGAMAQAGITQAQAAAQMAQAKLTQMFPQTVQQSQQAAQQQLGQQVQQAQQMQPQALQQAAQAPTNRTEQQLADLMKGSNARNTQSAVRQQQPTQQAAVTQNAPVSQAARASQEQQPRVVAQTGMPASIDRHPASPAVTPQMLAQASKQFPNPQAMRGDASANIAALTGLAKNAPGQHQVAAIRQQPAQPQAVAQVKANVPLVPTPLLRTGYTVDANQASNGANGANKNVAALQNPTGVHTTANDHITRAAGIHQKHAPNQLDYMRVKFGGQHHTVLTPQSRMQLVNAVEKSLNTQAHGIPPGMLYGTVKAETGWVPRDGMGNNGKISVGLTQMEFATARNLLGMRGKSEQDVRNALNHPTVALAAAAKLHIENTKYVNDKIKTLGLSNTNENRSMLYSVAYNTSMEMRKNFNGDLNSLPDATRKQIRGTIEGMQEYQRNAGKHIQAPGARVTKNHKDDQSVNQVAKNQHADNQANQTPAAGMVRTASYHTPVGHAAQQAAAARQHQDRHQNPETQRGYSI